MLDTLMQYARELKVFALGKGILSLAVFGTAALSAAFLGANVVWPAALVVGIGGTVLTAANRIYKQGLREQEMVDIYRDSVAQQLHIAPEQVTRATLREAGKDNQIIGQALEHQRKKTMLTIATAAVAGITSIALIGMFDMGNLLQGIAERSFTGMLEPIASFIGIGTVSTMTSLVVRDGLDTAIGYGSGISRADANDMITDMYRRIQRGQPVSREEVYGILVASDTVLDRTIEQRMGKHYASMNHAEQSILLQHFGVAEAMDKLAQDLSTGAVSPGRLAYMTADDYRPATSKMTVPENTPNHAKGKFVERLGLTTRPQNHAERISEQSLTPLTNAR